MRPHGSLFFPPPDEREVLGWAITEFPFPLSITYARLQDELNRQAPISAAWQLRDAFEATLKFTTCIAIADFLQAGPIPEDATRVISLLFKRGGLSLGDWFTLLVGQDDRVDKGVLRQLEPFAHSGSFEKSGRLFPELFNLFFKLKGKGGKQFSDFTKRIKGDGGSTNPNARGFIEWRNRVFGHGTFKSSHGFYVDEVKKWLPVLQEFLSALRLLFNGWTLLSVSPDGKQVAWQGADKLPPPDEHIHEPEGEPQQMRFTHLASSRSLPFGLLLSVQQCTHCERPMTFFFDSNRYDQKKEKHKTYFLEYFGGHEEAYRNWQEAQKLAAMLPPHFEWQRTSYDSEEVQSNLTLIFRDSDRELMRPDYLVDNFWRMVGEQPKGYVWLVGESGIGKTYFVHALEREGRSRGAPVLAYYILSGALSDYRTFVSELSDRAREMLSFHTQEAQTKVAAISDLREQFAEYIAELMRANGLETLVLAIDAIDGLPEPEEGAVAITGLLPSLEQLPAGCFVLLTSREVVHPRVRQDVEWLEQGNADTKDGDEAGRFTHITIRSQDAENQTLVRWYLQNRLPPQFLDATSVETVLQRCGGLFLYAFHFCRALESAAFSNAHNLPEARDFYPTYLARLSDATGLLYEQVYLKALTLLAAARMPVSTSQLIAWGIPKKDLPVDLPIALLGIKDFLRLQRAHMWNDWLSDEEGENRYTIAHEAFVRYLRGDEQMSRQLAEAHTIIARKALVAHRGRWEKLDEEDATQLYDLRFILAHLREAGLHEEVAALSKDEGYVTRCIIVGASARASAKHLIAIDLYDNVIDCRRISAAEGSDEAADGLAAALMDKGYVLWGMGKLAEAITLYEESISIYRALVEAGRGESEVGLSTALLNMGNAFGTQHKSVEAVKIFNEAIEIRRRLVDAGHAEMADGLAKLLMNKGIALRNLGRLAEAEPCFEEALVIRFKQDTPEDPDARAVHYKSLARTLLNKGTALVAGGKPSEANDLFDKAIKFYLFLANEGRSGLIDEWIRLMLEKGNALWAMGQPSEAMRFYDESIRLYQELVDEGRWEVANHLAGALMNKANVLRDSGRLEDALPHYDRASSIYQDMIGAGQPELAHDLASVLMNKGNALMALGRLPEADKLFDETVGLYRSLIEAGHDGFETHLAGTLLNKGNLFMRYDDLAKAIELYDEAIMIRRRLVTAGRHGLVGDLAAALVNKGSALFNHNKDAEAVEFFDEAIELYRGLVEAGNRLATKEFTRVLNMKGAALIRAGRPQEAAEVYDESIVLQRQLIDAGHDYLIGSLLEANANKGLALMEHGEHRSAVRCYDEAIKLAWQLIQEGQRPLTLVIGTMRNKVIALGRLKDWDNLLAQLDEIIGWLAACVDIGMEESLPELVQFMCWRVGTLLDLKRWDAVAQCVAHACDRARPLLQAGALPESLAEGLAWMRDKLTALAGNEREQVYARLGERVEVLQAVAKI